jgi:hypothetical protein
MQSDELSRALPCLTSEYSHANNQINPGGEMAWLGGYGTTDPGRQAVKATALFVCRTTCSQSLFLNAGGRVGVTVKANLAVITEGYIVPSDEGNDKSSSP